MASNYILIFAILILSFLQSRVQGSYVAPLNPKKLGLEKEKLTYLRFYMNFIAAGPSPTFLTIVTPTVDTMVSGAGPTNPTDGVFGTVNAVDNPLTEGPESSSKLIGKLQGVYTQTSHEETSLLMAFNFVFLQGKYNGSSITALGRNQVYDDVREMPVVGGSGRFRFSRGYAEYIVNATANDFICVQSLCLALLTIYVLGSCSLHAFICNVLV